MEDVHMQLITSNWILLIQRIRNPLEVCDCLLNKQLFTLEMVEQVRSKETCTDQARHVLLNVLTRGPDAFDIFCDALLATSNNTAADILKPGLKDSHTDILQQDLIYHYRRLFGKLQISPFIKEEGNAADFSEIYVQPILTVSTNNRSKKQSDLTQVKSYHDIFVKKDKPFHNIYISSPAGCGKTSFSMWMALTWCQALVPHESDNTWFNREDINEMQTFRYLFFVSLQDVQECDIDIMIQKQLLHKLEHSGRYEKLEFLQNILSSEKCIIILDGLDEWSHPIGNNCNVNDKRLPHCKARRMCTTLTTSRPWKLDVVKLEPAEIDQKLELHGLQEELLTELIRRVVGEMNKSQENKMKAGDFERKLKESNLTALSKAPVIVMQLLTLWHDNKPFGKSQCEIYSNMVEFLFERYFKRNADSDSANTKVKDCCTDQQIPLCFQNNVHCKAHVDLLSKLGELSLDTLFCDTQESSLTFNVTVVQNYISDTDFKLCLDIGILTQEKMNLMSERQSHVSFLHKTYQEFFAAFYIALSSGMLMAVEDKIKKICCSVLNILQMSKVFMFMSGLCPEVMSHLCEHMKDTVSAANETKKYRSSCELDWESEEGWPLFAIQLLMRDCLEESVLNGHKNIQLPVSDCFSIQSLWFEELKSFTGYNPICSLYVDGKNSPEEIEDILNSVAVFSSIQKLWLSTLTDDFVVQLVSEHKHSLSLRPETWSHLECVTFKWMLNISGDILCSLVDSILKLPKSVKVRLVGCYISQGRRDWNAYLLSHPQLTVDVNDCKEGFHLIRLFTERCNVNLLEFHTKKV